MRKNGAFGISEKAHYASVTLPRFMRRLSSETIWSMSVGEMLQATLGSRNILRVLVSWPEEDHGRGGETWLTASRRSCTSSDCTTWPSNLAGASQLNCAAASPRESFLRYGRSLSIASKVSATATIFTGNETSS